MSSTKIVKVDPANPGGVYLKEAADIVSSGGLVIIPTETVYGIAANRDNKKALERLYRIKGRPREKAFSLHIDSVDKVVNYALDVPVSAWKLIDRFWPGPLTLVLKSRDASTIGIRMPDDDIALRIIALSKVPVICPSANLSGKPAPRVFEEAIKDLNGLVDFGVDAGKTKIGIESTVVDLSSAQAEVLRDGAISREQIEKTISRKTVLFVCTGNSCRSVMAKALLENKLRRQKRNDVEVLSAGIMLLPGAGATEATKQILAREGMDVSGHRSQKITQVMLRRSDIILVMERLHEERILQIAPDIKNRVFLLREFAKIGDTNLDISDPIGQSMEIYEGTFNLIKEAIDKISNLI